MAEPIKKSTKADVYNKGLMFKVMYERLSNNQFMKYADNNRVVKIFIDAKYKGNYRSIMYDVNCPELTLSKNLSILKKIEGAIDKPFDALDQNDIDNFQQKLNDNSILLNPQPDKPEFTVEAHFA